jgi:methionyl aminopeptidase
MNDSLPPANALEAAGKPVNFSSATYADPAAYAPPSPRSGGTRRETRSPTTAGLQWDNWLMSTTYKDAAGIEGMRVAGKLASEVLDYLTEFVKPGITTNEIDRLAHDFMTQVQGTIPATLGYQPPGYGAYPKSLCTSVNHQVCHGIPNDKPLKKGDIVNIDVTVIKDGWHGDTSRMYLVGEASIAAKRLCSITYEAMWQGIMRVKPGIRLGDIGFAIQQFAERQGFSIVREFCGHARHDLHHRADDQRRQARHQGRP